MTGDRCEIVERHNHYVVYREVTRRRHLDQIAQEMVTCDDVVIRYADLDKTSVIKRAFCRTFNIRTTSTETYTGGSNTCTV